MLLRLAARGGDRRAGVCGRVSLHGVPTAYRLALWRQHLFPERAGAHRGARARSTCAAANSGRKIEIHFCPDCGSSVFWYAEFGPDLIGIAFGAFADPSMPWPTLSVWETTRHPWVTFDHQLDRFTVQPKIDDRDLEQLSTELRTLAIATHRPLSGANDEVCAVRVEIQPMSDQIERTLRRLGGQLPGRVSLPGEDGYAAATAIWAKPVGPMPRAVVHCRTTEDVQLAIRTARDCGLPLSVRGGGHDWAGRALCAGIVIDLSGMNGVSVAADHRSAIISGGARAADVAAVTDPLHVAAVTGTCSTVGMAGLTLGGGYGPLIGRFGLALDNLLAARGRARGWTHRCRRRDNEAELFWALRGGGGNFGVVTAMRYRLHNLPSVRSGLLVYPFAEARAVLDAAPTLPPRAPKT